MSLAALSSKRAFKREVRKLVFNGKVKLLYGPGLLLTLSYLVTRRVAPKRAEALQVLVPRWLCRAVLWLNEVEVQIQGQEHLDGLEGPLVVLANHNSRMDSYILGAYLPFGYRSFWSTESHTFKESYGAVRRFGNIFDLYFLHDKAEMMVTVAEFKRALEFLMQGGVLAFFPEGRVVSEAGVPMGAFGVSCISLAIQSRARVLPVILSHTKQTFENRRPELKRPALLRFGAPISTEGYRKRDAYMLAQRIHDRMSRDYDAMLNDLAPRAANGPTTAQSPRVAPADAGLLRAQGV